MIVEQDMERIISADLPWRDFKGATVLISGASGFIPNYMLKTLVCLGNCKVTALVRRPVDIPGVEVIIQDVRYPLDRRFDYVIHGASNASPKFYSTDPIGTLLANTRGTENMLNAAIGGAGFLYLSSGAIYSHLDTLDVRSCYGESKRMGEVMCTAWWKQVMVPAKMARISHTYGPGMKLDDGRVFADFTRDILNGGPLVMRSNGSTQRPFLYLADAAIGLFTIMLKGENGAAYNVANPSQFMAIWELAERLSNEFRMPIACSERQPELIPNMGVDIIPSIYDLNELGWKPTTTIEEGFRRTVESYQ